MEKNIVLVAGGALVVGVLFGMSISSITGHYSHGNRHDDDTDHHDHDDKKTVHHNDAASHDMAQMMHDMNAALEGKTGAEFDAVFLREMIVHHEGAVDMAKAALDNAGDERIKELSRAIIAAQEAEIEQMRSWQTQ